MAREIPLSDNQSPPSAGPLKGSELDGAYAADIPKRLNQNTVRGMATRLKLIKATIDCLYTQGYYRTSTILVAKEAGVSRGSMLNQFPTKADMMIAVAEHIAEARATAHIEGNANATSYEEKFDNLVPILWNELKSPTGVARIELMLASRSDPELAEKFAPLNDVLENSHRKVVWRLLKSLGLRSRALSDATVQLYAAALRGLCIDLMFPGRETTIENAASLLRAFLSTIVENEERYARALGIEPEPAHAS